jgi:hypothetical protein
MIRQRGINLPRKLINEQTLPCIMSRMPLQDWKQWEKESISWIHEDVKDAFWRFVHQRWKDSMHVAAADL